MDQLKEAEKGCDQVQDENLMIIQLEAENACKNKNLDNAIAEAGNLRIKEGNLKLRERLSKLEAESRTLKSD
nr:unnamed protein product [Callosobruchus chinensis]